jgi:Ala-tRNA(Pro) deacylase
MYIANRVRDYLNQRGVSDDIIVHPRTHGSQESAEAAHIPGDRLVKPVVLEDDKGYLMVVLPSTRRVQLGMLSAELQRRMRLATEAELKDLFADCELGAIPPLGPAYGMETVWDESLENLPEVYVEAGDHEELIRIDGKTFLGLLGPARHGKFSSFI